MGDIELQKECTQKFDVLAKEFRKENSMARLNYVKKAQKNYPKHNIKKGEPYFWWKFRFGEKRMSKNRPRRSQLTQSEFFSTMYDAEDDLNQALSDFQEGKLDLEGLSIACDDAAQMVRDVGDSCQEKLDNMSEGLQQGDTGQLLENRAQRCDSIADELESASSNITDYVKSEDDAVREIESVSWDYE